MGLAATKAALAVLVCVALIALPAEAAPRAAPTAAIGAALNRAPPPRLTPAERGAAAARLIPAATPQKPGATLSVSPGASYSAGFGMGFSYAYQIIPSPDGGLALLMPELGGGPEGSMELTFHAAPGKAYMLDCRLTLGEEAAIALYDGLKVASAFKTTASGGHIVWARFATPQGGDVDYQISPGAAGALIIKSCELTTIG